MLSTFLYRGFGTKCPEVPVIKEVRYLEENQGYVIQKSILFENGRGFALAESQTDPAPFVTWKFSEEQGHRDYYWGHYHTDREIAEKDYSARVSDYQRRYGVHEVRRPIAEQMQEAGTLAKEKRPDKVLDFPDPRRSRDREER